MKHVLFLLVAAVVISCNNSPKVAGTSEMVDIRDAAKKTEMVKEVYRAIETGDVSKIGTYIADDFVDHNANMDNSDVKGKDSALKMLSAIHTYFEPGFKVEFISDAVSEDGTLHYATMKMKGKAKQNPWGMPVGTDMDDTSVDMIKYKDGKATEHWGFMSMADFNEAMMMVQQTPPPAQKKSK